MEKLHHTEIIVLLLQLTSMLVVARIFAEIARSLKQPAVVGEILAGVLLGPTLFGTIAPDYFYMLFPAAGNSAMVLDGFIQVAVVLLLFIAGLEVDLHIVWQQGRQALLVSLFSMILPFGLGFLVSYFMPGLFNIADGDRIIFALFIGTILSVTALPVIARILMDLGIFKTNIGMLIIASAMIIDILAWLVFSVILSLMGSEGEKMNIQSTIGLTLGFTLFMLTVGRWLINFSLPWINKKLSWPGGLLSLSLALCFAAAAFTEYIGIHAIFGAFIIGVALGDSEHLSERAKEIIHQFINNIFAPLFFVSIGLYINVFESFVLLPILVLLITAYVGKIGGATLGARLGQLPKYDALAVGFGMNTHGTLEVILAAIALSNGIISEEIFVSVLVVVMITILTSAPLMKYCLRMAKEKESG